MTSPRHSLILRIAAVATILLPTTACSYAVVAAPGAPLTGDVTPFRVFANQGWQRTELVVGRGDVVRLRADGIWDPGGSMPCTAAGAEFPLYYYSPLYLLFYFPNPIAHAPINELLARVGDDGQVIRIGLTRDFVAVDSGTLQLRPNDWYLSNGVGYVDASISIEPLSKSPAPGLR